MRRQTRLTAEYGVRRKSKREVICRIEWDRFAGYFDGLYTMTWDCVVTRTLSLVENIADLDSGPGSWDAEVACLAILRSGGFDGVLQYLGFSDREPSG